MALALTGQKFGRLTVVSPAEDSSKSGRRWHCVCECGNETIVLETNLRRKKGTKSCGCLMRELVTQRNYKHGGSVRGNRERLYVVWQSLYRRCCDTKDKHYPMWGGRGITMCEEWKDYANFREWAYANGYDDKAKRNQCTIDRIDNNKGYSPDNCHFVDMKVQSNNRRTNRFVKYRGKNYTLSQLADISGNEGLTGNRIAARLKCGWSIEKSVNVPILKHGIRKEEYVA